VSSLLKRQTAVADTDPDIPDDVFATLPSLPSIEGFASRLGEIQDALNEARAEAESLRLELRTKADALRALAGALESI